MPEEKEVKAESFKVDLDSLDSNLVQEKIEINPDVNPLEAPPPVSDGIHRVRLQAVDESWEHSETKKDKAGNARSFIKCKVTGVVLAEGEKDNNKRLFINVNTLVFDGKSLMAYILIKALGNTPAAKEEIAKITNYVDLAKKFKAVLATEPIVKVSTKWKAQRKTTDANGKDKYETIITGQKNFPSDGQGGYRHVIQDKKTSTEVAAQAEVQDYFED